MGKLDFYIIKKYLSSFFFTMLLISMIAIVIDFSEKINKFLDADLGIMTVLTDYYVHFIPWLNGLMWPLFSLIAVIFFTSRIAKNTEIVAMLSSGISYYRIMVPYIVAASILAGLLWLGKNYVIPQSNKNKNDFEAEYVTRRTQKTINHDIHFFLKPEEKVYIRYYKTRDTTVQGFRLEKFQDGLLRKTLKAEKLLFKEAPTTWTIKDYEIRTFDGMDETVLIAKGETLDTILDITPADFVRNTKLMENMTTGDLKEYIQREKSRGLGAAKNFMIELHKRNSEPFSIIILTLMGMAIASRKVRGGMGLHLAIGIILGATFVIVSQFSATFSINLSMSPALGAWLPNILFGIVALILIRFSQK